MVCKTSCFTIKNKLILKVIIFKRVLKIVVDVTVVSNNIVISNNRHISLILYNLSVFPFSLAI